MEAGPSTFPSVSITLPNDGMQRWSNHRISSLSTLDDQRITPGNYEEIKKLIVLAGVFFMVAILFFLMKLEVPVDEIFKWSPIVWLIGVLLCCLFMNFLCFCRKVYKRRQISRNRRQEELLLSLNLATSFPCLAPPPHDAQCCGGRGVIWAAFREYSDNSLPSYAQALTTSIPLKESTVNLKESRVLESTSREEGEAPPPAYEEALKMLNN
uniref:Transmembrane protein 188 n=2 Tax=Parascaris univalens TaxID=6257 RepID=A0A914ZRL6_PARUN